MSERSDVRPAFVPLNDDGGEAEVVRVGGARPTLDHATRVAVAAGFTRLTGLPAPGVVGESVAAAMVRPAEDALRRAQRYGVIAELAFKGYLADLERESERAGVALDVSAVDPGAPRQPREVGARFEPRLGDKHVLRGWLFQVEEIDEGGMRLVPLGPAAKRRRRKAGK